MTAPVIPDDTGSCDTLLAVCGQRIRIRYRHGTGVPLVLCNGIGAGLEVLDPLVRALDPDRPVIRFDVPGTGESAASLLPYGFPYLAWVLGRILDRLDVGVVDVLGLSWGSALAQQFAFQNPRRCRRLILAATATGVTMVPGRPSALAAMATPRRFRDPDYAASIAGRIYGGAVRRRELEVADLFDRQSHAGSARGYRHQLMAGAVWSSLFALPALCQRTLIIAGDDDPIIPIINARIMTALIRGAHLHRHDGGHIDLVVDAARFAPVIDHFLGPASPAPARSAG
ncbi:poly(3-hydroxyalkanoate) depolymerase [Tsukamurella soli]|uniref:Poly(3-hydroxyalkanoate) depolymerase n=1 Tax=Tsukamurella soli TaxID=644556 RepID=A0ABP8JRE0_9ACTN